MKKSIILLIFLYAVSAHAQRIVNPMTGEKQDYTPLNAIAVTVGAGIPFISNDLINSDVWNKNIGFRTQLSVDFRKQITKEKTHPTYNRVVDDPTIFALGAGLGFSFYNKSADLKDYRDSIPGLIDKDGDKFDAILSSSNLKEKISACYLDIPLYVEIGRPSLTKLRAFGKIGIKPSILVSKDCTVEGTYTLEGFYKEIGKKEVNVTLRDIDVLGFCTDEPSYKNPEYKYQPFVLWANLSAGLSIPLSNSSNDKLSNTILRIGLKYDFALTKISKSTSEYTLPGTEVPLTGAKYNINRSNMLDGSTMQYLGLDMSLIFCLKYTQIR